MTQETIDRTFAVPAEARLRLSNVRGTTEIFSGEDGQIHVMAVKHLNTGHAAGTEVRIEQAESGEVVVETRFDEKRGFLIGREVCKVDYQVRVPRRCTLIVNGVSNPTRVREIEGEQHITTVSGALELADLTGDLRLNTVSGAVRAAELNGRLVVETISGPVEVLRSQLSMVTAKSVSAGIVLETALVGGAGDYRLNSVSGTCRLILPAGSGCVVEMSSLSGRLKTSFKATQVQGSPSQGRVTLHSGGPLVFFNSVSGNIWISSRQDPETGSPASGQAQPDSVLDLLQQIEDGEISVDEALSKLS